MEHALQHYHQALSVQSTITDPDNVLSDGALLRHFLLFIYDTCVPISNDVNSTEMWTIQLSNLIRIVELRRGSLGHEPYAHLVWYICVLETYACLLGHGCCDFLREISHQNMLPALEQQVPAAVSPLSSLHSVDDISAYRDILKLNEAVVLHTAKIAQAAQTFRSEADRLDGAMALRVVEWVDSVALLQEELFDIWTKASPSFSISDGSPIGEGLSPWPRYILEHVSPSNHHLD